MRAHLFWAQSKCGKCGQSGGLRPLPREARDVSWVGSRGAGPDETPETVVRVSVVRCVYCGSTEAVRAAWEEQHKDDEFNGVAMPKHGLIFHPHKPQED